MLDLQGQTAIVTGAARRIGRILALALAGRGVRVAITYRTSAEAAAATRADLEALGSPALALQCDQRRREQVRETVRAVEAAWGRVDILVNNASVFRRTPLEAVTEADWEEHLGVNLQGPFWFCQAAAPGMRTRGGGQILNIADIGAERPWPAYLPYCASKAGLLALTQGLARALAPEVRVNALCPGAILWPDDWPEEQRAAYLERVPLRRAGRPEDVAEAALFLLEGAEYVTGQALRVDGGRILGE